MTSSAQRWIVWAPRVLGLSVAVFLGIFAFDAFGENRAWSEALPGFLIHLTPALALVLTVALAWRREWLGGFVFILLAALYAALTWRRVDWVLTVAGPLLLVGLLFLLSWRYHEGRS